MKLLIHEVLQKVSNAKRKDEKIKLLQEFNTPALRAILIANFDESIVSMIPEGEVPYTPNDAPDGTEHTKLEHEHRILYHFFKGVLRSHSTSVSPCLFRCLRVDGWGGKGYDPCEG